MGKTNAGPSKTGTAVTSKFKIYSESEKVKGRSRDNVDANSSRTSLLSKKGTMLADASGLKGHASGAQKGKGSHDTVDKVNVGRKALADVSNIRGKASRFEKAGVSRKPTTFASLTYTASSSRPAVERLKANLADGVTASHRAGVTTSHTSIKANTRSKRTSSNFHRVQVHESAENITRGPSRSNNTIIRKSFPVLKTTSQLGANDSQGGVRSAGKAPRKLSFPVKTRVGKIVSQVANLKGKLHKDRVSDGFILTSARTQTNKDVPQRLRKSVKPVVRTSLRTANAQKNFKSKRISGIEIAVGTTSARNAEVATSIPKTSKSIGLHEVGGVPAEVNDKMKPNILESIASKRSNRRKSYTSLLMSRSKYLGQNKEVMEQEKLPNIDDQTNPLEVAEYVDDIYQYYWIMEAQSESLANYMVIQTDVTPQMRGILVNWLIEVHFKFDLMPETLYLSVALLDRYLSSVSIRKKELQLVGLTSLLLASKYEDFWHPRVKDLISISAESYTRKQMLEMEKDILKKLKFRLNLPTAYVFMLRFLKASQSDKQLEHLAFFLIELCLVDCEALKFRPSLLCASAVFVSRCTLNKVPAWTPLLARHAHYEEPQIRHCAEMILRLHKAASGALLKVTYDKYTKPEFGRVSTIKPLDSLPL